MMYIIRIHVKSGRMYVKSDRIPESSLNSTFLKIRVLRIEKVQFRCACLVGYNEPRNKLVLNKGKALNYILRQTSIKTVQRKYWKSVR